MQNRLNGKKRVSIVFTAFAAGAFAGLMPSVATVDALADTNLEHMTLQEIVVTDSIITDSATVVGTKTIEKGKNTTIPEAIKDEPDITISRRAVVGDTKDIVSIHGLSTNRIELDINGRPVNGSGVVRGYYIDWGTIPLDNIEKIEVIRGGSYQKADAFLWNNDFEGKNVTVNTEIDMPLSGLLTLGMQYSKNNRLFIANNRRSTDPDDPGFNQKINPDYPLSLGREPGAAVRQGLPRVGGGHLREDQVLSRSRI